MYTDIDDPDIASQSNAPKIEDRNDEHKIVLTIGGGLIAFVFIAGYLASNWETLRRLLC